MRVRVVGIGIAVAAMILASAAPALAWSNGVDGYHSYGTHDLILDHALTSLGQEADWLCVRIALRATDDPDSEDGIDHASGTWRHVYDIWGEMYGSAPEAVRVWFNRPCGGSRLTRTVRRAGR